MLDCEWQDHEIPCSQLFTLRPTDLGYCCGFNYRQWHLNGTDIPQKKYDANQFSYQCERTNLIFYCYFLKSVSPFSYNSRAKVNIAGRDGGLRIVLDTISEDFAIPIGRSGGFKVLVHNPREYPNVDSMGFNISPGFENFVGIGKDLFKCL